MTPRTLALATATELAVGCALAIGGQASPAAHPVSKARRFMNMLLSGALLQRIQIRPGLRMLRRNTDDTLLKRLQQGGRIGVAESAGALVSLLCLRRVGEA